MMNGYNFNVLGCQLIFVIFVYPVRSPLLFFHHAIASKALLKLDRDIIPLIPSLQKNHHRSPLAVFDNRLLKIIFV